MDRYSIDFEEIELAQPFEMAAHEDMTMPCMYAGCNGQVDG